ncbi:winged helix-turn-helix domain-containing protein [Gemmatimonadota bacterium]
MRPPTKQQDPLEAPLNEILGSVASVRILRVLSASQSAMGRSEVARKAELYPTGVRKVIDQLADLGLVDIVGSGRNKVVSLRDKHPLAHSLRSLFTDERELYRGIIRAVRRLFTHQVLPVQAVWIENPVSRSPGTIDIGILGPLTGINTVVQLVEENLREIEHDIASHFVIHGYTDADLHTASQEQKRRLAHITLLYGWIPLRWKISGGGPIRTHQDLNERARMVATRLADHLSSDPSLIERALEWIDERQNRASDHEQHALEEWRSILTELSVQQVQSFLMEQSERADRLRQSLPFVEVLTDIERKSALDVNEHDQG